MFNESIEIDQSKVKSKKSVKKKKKKVKKVKVNKDDFSWINDSSIFKVSTSGLPQSHEQIISIFKNLNGEEAVQAKKEID
jgi:hypothetical protein